MKQAQCGMWNLHKRRLRVTTGRREKQVGLAGRQGKYWHTARPCPMSEQLCEQDGLHTDAGAAVPGSQGPVFLEESWRRKVSRMNHILTTEHIWTHNWYDSFPLSILDIVILTWHLCWVQTLTLRVWIHLHLPLAIPTKQRNSKKQPNGFLFPAPFTEQLSHLLMTGTHHSEQDSDTSSCLPISWPKQPEVPESHSLPTAPPPGEIIPHWVGDQDL